MIENWKAAWNDSRACIFEIVTFRVGKMHVSLLQDKLMIENCVLAGAFIDGCTRDPDGATGGGTGTTMRQFLRTTVVFLLLLSHSPLVIAQQPTADRAGVSEDQAPSPPAGVATPAAKAVPVGLRELSPWSMFLSASLVPQAIMIALAFASLVTWTIFIGKLLELFISRRRLVAALRAISDAQTLTEALSALSFDRSVLRSFVATAINEARLSADIDNETGIKERVASSFSEITRSESRRVRFGMGALATIAATSPFIGLFGTVWGIMNSFIGISKSQTTNLAVVAPGIAEALLATAIGLFAAIPAVVIYNHFSRVTKGHLEMVNRAAGAAGRQLSRDLDRMPAAPMRRAAE
jgi:biopolymer transport protein ExbB